MVNSATPSTASPTDALLRRGFKSFNRFMVLMWRLGLGPWLNAAPRMLGRYLILIHTGRNSGRTYSTPVNYAEVNGELYCTAGFGVLSDWYRNLMANPSGQVWLPNGWYNISAEDVTAGDGALPILREVLIASAFAARAAGINPRRMSDSALREATTGYCLLHLTRESPRTGPGGPGDWAWVWPAAIMVLPFLWLFARWGQPDKR